LSIVAAVLGAVLILSLTPLFSAKKSVPLQLSLLNPKYSESVAKIQIQLPQQEHYLELERHDTFWTGSYCQLSGYSASSEIWPADISQVKNLISSASKVCKFYKKADSVSNYNRLSVTKEQAAVLRFYGQDNQILSELYFGIDNTATNRIAVRSSAKPTVYELSDDITVFLKDDTSFWCDPYIYPQWITGMSDEEAKQLLRHGQLFPLPPETEKYSILNKDFGNGAEVSLHIYQGSDSFVVVPLCVPSKTVSAVEKRAVESLAYAYSVSAWTMQHVKSE